MPKKFQGENSKASIARSRKAEKSAEEKAVKDKATEDALWNDDDKTAAKKIQRKEEKEKKRLEELQRKAENRALAEEEVKTILPVKPAPQNKVTVHQLQVLKEQQAEEAKKQEQNISNIVEQPLVENLNRLDEDIVSGSGIDGALAALSTAEKEDRHPEKRLAAAYRAFEEVRMPQLKKENPNFRLSQLKQLLRKEWMKSPQNPINQRNLAMQTM